MQLYSVPVTAEFKTDGRVLPRWFTWENGHRFKIDRVTGIRQAASLKDGSLGDRYTCQVEGRLTYMYFKENRWWIEG